MQAGISRYLSGLPVAMSHKLYKVVDYKVLTRYTVWVKFDDESEQIINLEPVLYGEMWGHYAIRSCSRK